MVHLWGKQEVCSTGVSLRAGYYLSFPMVK